MPELSVESNGRIENTAVYYNGEQVRGIKELLVNIDETGTFDAILSYATANGKVLTKNVLQDMLDQLQTMEPSFSEEEAQSMRLLTVISEGDLESTTILRDGQDQFGIVSMYVHIKAPPETQFKAEIVYREEDGSLTTEGIF